MRQFVVDCSVSLSWCFPDESEPYALAVRDALRKSRAHAPSVWLSETANGLLAGERRNRLTGADVDQLVLAMKSLGVVIDDGRSERWIDEIIQLGRDHGLSAYDACYLELAIRLGLPIATLDEALLQAAIATGVSRFDP